MFNWSQLNPTEPMRVVNPGMREHQPNIARHLTAEQDRAEAALAKRTIHDLNDNVTPENLPVWNKVRHTMRKDETLGQWYARVGLGRSQVLAMSKSEITEFVKQADLNNADKVREPRSPLFFNPEPAAPVTLLSDVQPDVNFTYEQAIP